MERRPATYQDVLDAPSHQRAELLHGELILSARPASPHLRVQTALGADLFRRFDSRPRDDGDRPGGWVLVHEPELWLGRGPDPRDVVLVPDLAAWRWDRFPHGFRGHGHTVAPDLVVEVLSPSTARLDRIAKADAYAAAGVPWLWLVDPDARSVEVHALRDGVWARLDAALDHDCRPLPPFEGAPVDVGSWWPEDPSEAADAAGTTATS